MHDIFYFTDIHGHYDLYSAIINWCRAKDPECTIIYGGDGCDRGPYGYRIMRELLDNPQVIYLKGNHEDMFVKAAREIIGFHAGSDETYTKLKSKNSIYAKQVLTMCDRYTMPNLYLHLYNDGERTIIDWIVDGANEDFIDKIEHLPLTFSYENTDFCHAGTTYKIFSDVADKEYHKEPIPEQDIQNILWNRTMLPLGWKTGRVCLFGHTPTITLPKGIYGRDQSLKHVHPCAWQDKMGGMNKRGGWKIDMDTCAWWSDQAFVLDCLAMKVYGFKMETNGLIKNLNSYKII